LSLIAVTQISRNAVPTIWSISGPHTEWPKYLAGNVAKIEKVASAFPALFGVPFARSNALMAVR
jgi:hypothetical protein